MNANDAIVEAEVVGLGTAWHSPGSIYTLGHKLIATLLQLPVQVQEKVDGSYFAFGMFPEIDKGEGPLRLRSKGAVMHVDAPQDMFKGAVATVKALSERLTPGWMYRAEVLCKPKHNTLAYDRIPTGHLILHDICTAEETFLGYAELAAEAARLGLEVVPQLGTYGVSTPLLTLEDIKALLSTVSVLGGQKIEGVVIKPLVDLYGPDKKLMMGKFVSEAFKEAHSVAWKEGNPTGRDILGQIGQRFNHPGRWTKAVQHLREAGKIEDSPRDIGPLIKAVPLDVLKEEHEAIKDYLFKWAWPHIAREVTRGLPEWYKEQLLQKQFAGEPVDANFAPAVAALVAEDGILAEVADMMNDSLGG